MSQPDLSGILGPTVTVQGQCEPRSPTEADLNRMAEEVAAQMGLPSSWVTVTLDGTSSTPPPASKEDARQAEAAFTRIGEAILRAMIDGRAEL